MSCFTLVFRGRSFLIQKRSLLTNCDVCDVHPEIYDTCIYEVQSSVSFEQFDAFFDYLQQRKIPTLTSDNVQAFLSLSREFIAGPLETECLAFLPDPSGLGIRVSALEEIVYRQQHLFELFQSDFPRLLLDPFSTRLAALEARLSTRQADVQNRLSRELSDLKAQFADFKSHVSGQQTRLESSVSELNSSITSLRIAQEELREYCPQSFGFTESAPMNGIISELTRIHSGNVCEKGIVDITVSSNAADAFCLADLASRSSWSCKAADAWACWDFRDLLVRIDGYSLACWGRGGPKSWVIEGSLDGSEWTDFNPRKVTHKWREDGRFVRSFSVAKTPKLRFVRIAQLSQHSLDSGPSGRPLTLIGVEFFGSTVGKPLSRFGLPRPAVTIKCPLKERAPWDGIIAYLTREHGENLHDKDVVTVTAKSVDESRDDFRDFHPLNVLDLAAEWLSFASNGDEPNQWICWDFHDIVIRPTHYQIETPMEDALQSWVLESSMDGQEWTGIDRQAYRPGVQWTRPGIFAMTTVANARFIRLTQVGSNSANGNVLRLQALELYGSFDDPSVSRAERRRERHPPTRLDVPRRPRRSLSRGSVTFK
jgi:hypothetical protein